MKAGESYIYETVTEPYWMRFWVNYLESGDWQLSIEVCDKDNDYLTESHDILTIQENEYVTIEVVASVIDTVVKELKNNMED